MRALTFATVLLLVSACGGDDSDGQSATGGGAGQGGTGGKAGTGGTGGSGGSGGSGATGGGSGSGSGGTGSGGSSGAGGSGGSGGSGAAKRVFVTSQVFEPDFGSATAGDAACQTAADAESLGGTWMAWLSDETTSPSQRFSQATIPYALLDGTTVASSFTDLIDGQLAVAIDRDETNAVAGAVAVWTGTKQDGTPAFDTCSDWTVAIANVAVHGVTDATDAGWTNTAVAGCIQKNRLYCFEQ